MNGKRALDEGALLDSAASLRGAERIIGEIDPAGSEDEAAPALDRAEREIRLLLTRLRQRRARLPGDPGAAPETNELLMEAEQQLEVIATLLAPR